MTGIRFFMTMTAVFAMCVRAACKPLFHGRFPLVPTLLAILRTSMMPGAPTPAPVRATARRTVLTHYKRDDRHV